MIVLLKSLGGLPDEGLNSPFISLFVQLITSRFDGDAEKNGSHFV